MAQRKNESILHFTLGRSRSLKRTIDCLHVLSIFACWLSELPLVYRLILSLLVVLSWFVQHKVGEAANILLRYTVSESWAVSFDGEHYLSINIKPTTVTGSMLTVLHFNIDQHTRALVIFKDAMSSNDYRKLIVNLKISGYGQG